MMSDWRTFLQQAGAVDEEGRIGHFGAPEEELRAAVEGDIVVDLSHRGLVRIDGADAAGFLQGQTTNDVRQVSDTLGQLSAHCSPKGRILFSFRLFRRDGAFYLSMPAELSESFIERLRKYVLMSKVVIEDAGEQLMRIGVSGEAAARRLGAVTGGLPAEADETLHGNGLTVIRVRSRHPRFEVYGLPSAITTLWQELTAAARPVGAAAWDLLDIRDGLPTVVTATSELFVPQMLNLPLVGGVSFTKGCYPGQEIVARMQYLGSLKRRMYLGHVDNDPEPKPGDAVFSPATESGQGTGRVVMAAPSPDGGYDLLAVIELAVADHGAEIRLHDAAGATVRLQPLPYAFPPDKQ